MLSLTGGGIMMRYASVVSAAVLAASVAQAQPIALRPAQTATISFKSGRAVLESVQSAAPVTKFEAYVIWHAQHEQVPPNFTGVMPPSFLGPVPGIPEKPTPAIGKIQLTFRIVPAVAPGMPQHSILFIGNGVSSKFTYRASLRRNGRASSTDVCEVPPNSMGLEHWPYPVDEIEVSDLVLAPLTEGIVCR